MNGIAVGRDRVWAVGDDGVIERYAAGGARQRAHLRGRANLHAIDLQGPAWAVAVGEAGTWWRWDGDRWTRGRRFTGTDLCAVQVAAPDDLLVGAVDGRLWRLSGERPVSVAERSGAGAVSSLWRCRETLWGVAGRTVFRLAGTRRADRWELPGRPHLHAVCGATAREEGPVYAAGTTGAWRFDPVAGLWQPLAGGPCYGATCTPEGDCLYVVTGSELHSWTAATGWQHLGTTGAMLGSLALDPAGGMLWVAGTAGVFRYPLRPPTPGGSATGAGGLGCGVAVPQRVDPEATVRYEDSGEG